MLGLKQLDIIPSRSIYTFAFLSSMDDANVCTTVREILNDVYRDKNGGPNTKNIKYDFWYQVEKAYSISRDRHPPSADRPVRVLWGVGPYSISRDRYKDAAVPQCQPRISRPGNCDRQHAAQAVGSGDPRGA